MFTCHPKYNINLGDKYFDNSLSLYFKFLRNYFMKEGNNVIMTMYYSALYTLSKTMKEFTKTNHLLKLVMNVEKLLK